MDLEILNCFIATHGNCNTSNSRIKFRGGGVLVLGFDARSNCKSTYLKFEVILVGKKFTKRFWDCNSKSRELRRQVIII